MEGDVERTSSGRRFVDALATRSQLSWSTIARIAHVLEANSRCESTKHVLGHGGPRGAVSRQLRRHGPRSAPPTRSRGSSTSSTRRQSHFKGDEPRSRCQTRGAVRMAAQVDCRGQAPSQHRAEMRSFHGHRLATASKLMADAVRAARWLLLSPTGRDRHCKRIRSPRGPPPTRQIVVPCPNPAASSGRASRRLSRPPWHRGGGGGGRVTTYRGPHAEAASSSSSARPKR